jgi:hypothetical protein
VRLVTPRSSALLQGVNVSCAGTAKSSRSQWWWAIGVYSNHKKEKAND